MTVADANIADQAVFHDHHTGMKGTVDDEIPA